MNNFFGFGKFGKRLQNLATYCANHHNFTSAFLWKLSLNSDIKNEYNNCKIDNVLKELFEKSKRIFEIPKLLDEFVEMLRPERCKRV